MRDSFQISESAWLLADYYKYKKFHKDDEDDFKEFKEKLFNGVFEILRVSYSLKHFESNIRMALI